MGCCFSKATTQNPQNQKNKQPQSVRSSLTKSNPTHEEPPPPLEEESVKEVLSETPISKPNQVPILIAESKTQLPLHQNPVPVFMAEAKTQMPLLHNQVSILMAEAKTQMPLLQNQVPILMAETKTQMPLHQNPPEKFETKDVIEEISEVVSSQLTEACSISESFSAATTATTATVTEKREDEATSKQSVREGAAATQKWSRSPSRKRPHTPADGRERRAKSPARRPEPSPSPEKRVKGGSRLVRGRDSGPMANRKLNASPSRVCRDAGEGSGRRSRSPSCARKTGGTSKVNPGGDRKPVPPPATNGAEEKKSESEEVGEKNGVVQQGESLDNPHVSMECFIFL